MVAGALKCPFCRSEDDSTSNGKKRYAGNNTACSHKTGYAEYPYNGGKPDVKQAIVTGAADGAGIRATARGLGVTTDTVINELQKKKR